MHILKSTKERVDECGKRTAENARCSYKHIAEIEDFISYKWKVRFKDKKTHACARVTHKYLKLCPFSP